MIDWKSEYEAEHEKRLVDKARIRELEGIVARKSALLHDLVAELAETRNSRQREHDLRVQMAGTGEALTADQEGEPHA